MCQIERRGAAKGVRREDTKEHDRKCSKIYSSHRIKYSLKPSSVQPWSPQLAQTLRLVLHNHREEECIYRLKHEFLGGSGGEHRLLGKVSLSSIISSTRSSLCWCAGMNAMLSRYKKTIFFRSEWPVSPFCPPYIMSNGINEKTRSNWKGPRVLPGYRPSRVFFFYFILSFPL